MVQPMPAHRWMSGTVCPQRASGACECSVLSTLTARAEWGGSRRRLAPTVTEGREPRRARNRRARNVYRAALHQSAGVSERRPLGGGPEATTLRSARCGLRLSQSAGKGALHHTARWNGEGHAFATACVVTNLSADVRWSGWLHVSGARHCRASALGSKRGQRSAPAGAGLRGASGSRGRGTPCRG
jgi:hypothetical protein